MYEPDKDDSLYAELRMNYPEKYKYTEEERTKGEIIRLQCIRIFNKLYKINQQLISKKEKP